MCTRQSRVTRSRVAQQAAAGWLADGSGWPPVRGWGAEGRFHTVSVPELGLEDLVGIDAHGREFPVISRLTRLCRRLQTSTGAQVSPWAGVGVVCQRLCRELGG